MLFAGLITYFYYVLTIYWAMFSTSFTTFFPAKSYNLFYTSVQIANQNIYQSLDSKKIETEFNIILKDDKIDKLNSN